MSKLVDYLNHLDQNADASAAHAKDPHAAMTHFGLSHEEQAAIKSGNKSHVAKVAGIAEADVPSIQSTDEPR
ncbi:hypothetical protein ACO0KY_10500 [Undibacterium sp. Dicai25W]|uniref:hypothetical protein n=1 Tax=Undibacterium sp. Dicai25W TaxID=3413034 RepID=UPI003BF2D275